jgi:hypothetical protein
MAALAVGGDLSFVDRHESQIPIDWHRLGRAQQPARVPGLDPLLACDQRDPVRTLGYYIAFYAISVALVFFVMGCVSRAGGGDNLADYAGLGRR